MSPVSGIFLNSFQIIWLFRQLFSEIPIVFLIGHRIEDFLINLHGHLNKGGFWAVFSATAYLLLLWSRCCNFRQLKDQITTFSWTLLFGQFPVKRSGGNGICSVLIFVGPDVDTHCPTIINRPLRSWLTQGDRAVKKILQIWWRKNATQIKGRKVTGVFLTLLWLRILYDAI